ncbi:hypothetical protein CSKR_104336 [Clonorchis sinensis]|uniref:Uncharacterized protein n=1 Tax=Clonorchis sinensis TaxID=79923 RepID=A0A419QDI0_CLOSI|nr:hypothetical protein CSKR_104336 [Clonorchis sinensis]
MEGYVLSFNCHDFPAHIKHKKPFSCGTLSMHNCHAIREKHEGFVTARLPKLRQEKSKCRGRVGDGTDRKSSKKTDKHIKLNRRIAKRPSSSCPCATVLVSPHQRGKQLTRASLLLELISSAYPIAALGFELCTSDMRSERVTATTPAHTGLTRIFTFEQVKMFALG